MHRQRAMKIWEGDQWVYVMSKFYIHIKMPFISQHRRVCTTCVVCILLLSLLILRTVCTVYSVQFVHQSTLALENCVDLGHVQLSGPREESHRDRLKLGPREFYVEF